MPVRIYDIAKKLGIESKAVLAKAKELSIANAKVPSSSLDKITAAYLEEQLGGVPTPPPEPPPPPAPEPVVLVTTAPEPEAPAPPEPEPAPPDSPVAEPDAEKLQAEPSDPATETPIEAEPTATAAAASDAPAPEETETVIAPESTASETEPPVTEEAAEPPKDPGLKELEPERIGIGGLVGRINLPTPRPPGRGAQAKPGAKGAAPARPASRTAPAKPDAKSTPALPKFIPPSTGEVVTLKPPIVVRELADKVGRKPFQIIADLMELGVFATVNQAIDEPIAQRVCAKHGFRFEVERRERGGGTVHAPKKPIEIDVEDKPEDLRLRAPVVTIMGHVDHGKTTLLDVIRKTNVVAKEAGGITQHIGAYTISIPHPERKKDLQQITFLDTPGHAAFTSMRARGANVTDVVVLVVAANDGVMPQTREAINHAKDAKVPILVAVNKIDVPGANPMQARQQLQELGLVCEEWGGNTIFVDLSALQKQGVDKLLEMLVLQADILELKANPNRKAKGNVIESGLEAGGPVATVLVRNGTLHLSDPILCGPFYGKVRALINEDGKRVKEAGPSVAVKVLGLNGVPEAGLEFAVQDNLKDAEAIGVERREQERSEQTRGPVQPNDVAGILNQIKAGEAKILKTIIKADTQGSVEAIAQSLQQIKSEKASLEVVHSAVGPVTENDVNMAASSPKNSVILGFHTRVDSSAASAAKHRGVGIKLYAIIYELIDEVKLAMAGLLDPMSKEVTTGTAEVRQVFALSKGGNVAGCVVTNGRITKGKLRVRRRSNIIFTGMSASLRRFQDEVHEVRSGLECGIRLDGFNDFQVGDQIECFAIEKVAQEL
jgi:translation initiation factor IF-2